MTTTRISTAELTCERCDAPPLFVGIDEPDNDGGLMFGDQILGVLLCAACLGASEVDGPWSVVEAWA